MLIKSNHDRVNDLRYKMLYNEVCDYKEVGDTIHGNNVDLVLCHYPMLMWKNQHHGTILLYGHLHNSTEESYFRKCLQTMNSSDFAGRKGGDKTIRAYNVGCIMPYVNYEPQTLEEIVERADR